MNRMNRRTFIQITGAGLAAAGLSSWALAAGEKTKGVAGVGMCDWTLGGRGDPAMIPKAREIGLDGIQVALGNDPDNVPLRDPAVREHYVELSKAHNIRIVSTAPTMLNRNALFSDPRAPGLVADAIDAARFFGAKNILVPFFTRGADLRLRKGDEFNDLKDGAFSSYELNTEAVEKSIDILRALVPRAEEAGVAIGLENTLTAKQNLEMIEKIGSKIVQVYYDLGNSWGNGYDVPGELRLLGNDRICEIHLKDLGSPLFGSEKAQVDMPECAKALIDIGYDKWLVIESPGRKDKLVEDTRTNIAYARKTFRFA